MIKSLPDLAQAAIEHYLQFKAVLPTPTEGLEAFRDKQAGIFVTLQRDGDLRGCIGTIQPVCENMLVETIQNAISAATRDHRFPPVDLVELPSLSYSVSVLHPPEQITGLDQLDAKRYGVIVVAGERRGLLLPDLDGVETPEQQIQIAMQKAGLSPGAQISLYRFQVDKHD